MNKCKFCGYFGVTSTGVCAKCGSVEPWPTPLHTLGFDFMQTGNVPPRLVVFVDMDEVLAEWVRGACKLHGKTEDEMAEYCGTGPWWTGPKLWAPINNNPGFWADLDPTPWCFDLMTWLGFRGHDVYLLSTPHECESSYVGKLWWVSKHLPHMRSRLILTEHKHLLSRHGRILLDDNSDNVKKFSEYGGMGLLFPHRRNGWAGPQDQILPYVQNMVRLTEELRP